MLSDQEKRSVYDLAFDSARLHGHRWISDFTVDFDFGDILGDLFGWRLGRSSTRATRCTRHGADLQYRIDLTFEEPFGINKEIEITRDELCSTCSGSGAKPGTSPHAAQAATALARSAKCARLSWVRWCRFPPACVRGEGETVSSPCPTCQGRGLMRHTRRKVVEIPAGVDTGTPDSACRRRATRRERWTKWSSLHRHSGEGP